MKLILERHVSQAATICPHQRKALLPGACGHRPGVRNVDGSHLVGGPHSLSAARVATHYGRCDQMFQLAVPQVRFDSNAAPLPLAERPSKHRRGCRFAGLGARQPPVSLVLAGARNLLGSGTLPACSCARQHQSPVGVGGDDHGHIMKASGCKAMVSPHPVVHGLGRHLGARLCDSGNHQNFFRRQQSVHLETLVSGAGGGASDIVQGPRAAIDVLANISVQREAADFGLGVQQHWVEAQEMASGQVAQVDHISLQDCTHKAPHGGCP